MPISIDSNVSERVFARFGETIIVPVDNGLRPVAVEIAAVARRTRSFKDVTRNTRGSIDVDQQRDRRGRFASGWRVVAGFATLYLEFGTIFMGARRFLADARDTVSPYAEDILAKHMRRGVPAAFRRAARG
ncbi:MAG: hypothetical protein OXH70_17800 [Acidobacteria bacterium]|nr:hypothetical protein [Acidobacteriota bacterium]